jgi:hypothetical protein
VHNHEKNLSFKTLLLIDKLMRKREELLSVVIDGDFKRVIHGNGIIMCFVHRYGDNVSTPDDVQKRQPSLVMCGA